MSQPDAKLSTLVTRAGFWSVLSQAIVRSAQIVAGLVFVVVLSPSEVGVWFFALSIVSLPQLVIEAGPGQALVQNERDDSGFISAVFVLSILVGIASAVSFWLFAPLLAEVLQDETAELPLAVIAFAVLFNAASRTHIALARRRLDFRSAMYVESAGAFGPLVVGIPLAIAGFGVWAPIVGTIVGAGLGALVAAGVVRLGPITWPDRVATKFVLRFSGWTVGEALLGWLSTWGGAFFVGIYLTSSDTGLFRTSEFIPLLVFGALSAALGPVVLSAASRLRADSRAVDTLLDEANRLIALVVAGFGMGVVLLAGAIEEILGSEWGNFSTLVVIQTVSHMLGALLTTFLPTLIALDHRALAFAYRLCVVGLLIPAYLIVVPLGLEVFIWSMLVIRLVVVLIAWAVSAKTSVSFRSFLFAPVGYYVVAAALAAPCYWAGGLLSDSTLMGGAVSIVSFAILFGGYLLHFQRDRLSATVNRLLQR